MPVLEKDVEWASQLVFDSTTGRPNKEEIPEELRASGLQRQQALPRPFINQLLYSQGQAILTVQEEYIAAIEDLQGQVDALTTALAALDARVTALEP